MTEKERYRELCRKEASMPLFCRDWWLDAACGESNWDVVLVERGGRIIGVLPFHIRVRLGLKLIQMPHLTQFMGPWLAYPDGQKSHTRLSFEKEILGELIAGLPSFDYFSQRCHHAFTNWLPFHWHGFSQTTRYTYLIDNLADLDGLFAGFRSNVKTDIHKAQKKVRVIQGEDLEKLYHLNNLSFARQKRSAPYDLNFLRRVDAACVKQGRRRILFAEGEDGSLHAAVYIVWDDWTTYYLMGGGDPELRNSGATSLLLWEAIQFSATVTRQFDFEGSMIEPVERFFRAFGATQRPYFQISKVNSRMIRLQQFAKEFIQS